MAHWPQDRLTALLPRQWVASWRALNARCEHRREKLLLAAFSALCSSAMLRAMASIVATIAPTDSWAAERAQEVVSLAGLHFWLCMGFASAGGVASLFHDLRRKPSRFSLANAVGHMFISQFAGLLAFVGVVGAQWALPWALGICGIAGWMGAAAITKVSAKVERKIDVLFGVSSRDGE
ncbi:MAG: phage holin family protein [Burkholderiales bacterium]|nr:phage holin family protein [Burkholderiales bacterium]